MPSTLAPSMFTFLITAGLITFPNKPTPFAALAAVAPPTKFVILRFEIVKFFPSNVPAKPFELVPEP